MASVQEEGENCKSSFFIAHCFDKQLSNTVHKMRKCSKSGRCWWELEGAVWRLVCSSLDAKGSFFGRACVVIFVFCCIFGFKKSWEKSYLFVKLSICLFLVQCSNFNWLEILREARFAVCDLLKCWNQFNLHGGLSLFEHLSWHVKFAWQLSGVGYHKEKETLDHHSCGCKSGIRLLCTLTIAVLWGDIYIQLIICWEQGNFW